MIALIDFGALPVINNYSLCKDVVSVYHYEDGEVTKTVHQKAFFDNKKVENVENTGSTETNGFLLVIPGSEQACKVGDKVMRGDGVDVPTKDVAAWWRSFVPAKVDDLSVIKYVDVKRYGGAIVHTEAGG